MKKGNKMIAAIMAVTVAMNAMMVPAMAVSGNVPTGDGTYTTVDATAWRTTDSSASSSMADYIYSEVEATISGDEVELVFYFINDNVSEKITEQSAGQLQDNKITYNDMEYAGSLEIAYENVDAPVYDDFRYDVVTFTNVPASILAEDYIYMTSYVTVMGIYMPATATQSYLVELIWQGDAEDTQTMEITATVPSNVSTYYASIPESAELKTLSTTEDTSVNYEVSVNVGTTGKTITVETGDAILTDAAGFVSLAVSNTFGTGGVATFDENGAVTGKLTVEADAVAEIAKEDAQNLSGSISFKITVA